MNSVAPNRPIQQDELLVDRERGANLGGADALLDVFEECSIAGLCLKHFGHRLLKGMTTANSDVLCQGVANSRDSVATFATHFLRECVASVIVQQAIAQVPETYWKSLGRSHTDQPVGPLLKVCRIFVANSADCAGFADSADS